MWVEIASNGERLSLFLRKAFTFTNHHHPLLLVMGYTQGRDCVLRWLGLNMMIAKRREDEQGEGIIRWPGARAAL